jgi:exodeoxyribonuclease-3
LIDAGVDKDVRGQDGASDHAPTWIMLDVAASRTRTKKGSADFDSIVG